MARKQVRDDGRYSSKISLGNGKYKYVYAYSPSELEKKVRQIKGKQDRGLDLSAERDTFGYWREKWLRVKKSETSDAWYNSCEIYSKKLSSFDLLEISQLKAIDLQELLLDTACETSPATHKPYSQKVLKIIKDIASSIMDMAFDNRVIDFNPFARVKVPKAQKEVEKREALTKEQQQWIVNTPHRAQTAAMIMLFAGLRRGELLALLWSDIDLENKTININKSVVMEKGIPRVKPGGKTDAATRTVYIPDILVNYLKTVPRKTLLVCANTSGQLVSNTVWKKMWESYKKELNLKYGDFSGWNDWRQNHGPDERPPKNYPKKIPMVIPDITAHWLRHTFVTNMYHAGVDIMTAKQQAGHTDIKVTIGIYTHLDNEYKTVSMGKLNDYLQELPKNGVVS